MRTIIASPGADLVPNCACGRAVLERRLEIHSIVVTRCLCLFLSAFTWLSGSTFACAQNWTLTSAPTNNWSAIAGSANLTVLAATVDGGGIYYSTNSGTSWKLSDAPSNTWSTITCSTNGILMIAAVKGGGIWTSSNAGATWAMGSVQADDWTSIAGDATGDRLIAATDTAIWLSTNYGTNWVLSSAPISGYPTPWQAVVSSADGATLVAAQGGDSGLGEMFLSTNSGTTWVEIRSVADLQSAALSANGDILAADTCCDGFIYASANFGRKWTVSPYGLWDLVALSNDGNKGVSTELPPLPTYVTADAGGTWVALNGTPAMTWAGVFLSADGNRFVVAANGGGIYAWQPTIPLVASQPETQIVLGGLNVTLDVGVFSTVPLTYQWQFDTTNLFGATNSTLALTNADLWNAGAYTVVVSNSYGTTISSNAVLTIVPAFISTLSPDWGISDAILGGSVSTGSNSTVVWFNWGADTNYGNATPAYPVNDGVVSLNFSNRITGLAPYITYHYQAVASNSLGVVLGMDVAFTTAPRFIMTSGINGDWNTFAWTADGAKMAATWSNTVYLSSDSGASWTATAGMGYYVILSADGTRVIAVGGSVLSLSTNAGASWSTNSTPAAFSAFAASADAGKLIAVGGSQLYTSTNSGAAWMLTSAPVQDWVSVTSSADGTDLVALSHIREGGVIYRSTDSGVTWVGNTSTDSEYYIGVVISSADGSVLVMTGEEGMISTNSGVNWNGPVLTGTTGAALSADGTKMIVVYQEQIISPPTEIFFLPELPVAFEPDPAVLANAPSQAEIVLITSDGTKYAALINGDIYIAEANPSPVLTVAPWGDSVALSWMEPSAPFILQQSSDLMNWSAVTNAPILNITNLQDQVLLPISQTQNFYRLKTP